MDLYFMTRALFKNRISKLVWNTDIYTKNIFNMLNKSEIPGIQPQGLKVTACDKYKTGSQIKHFLRPDFTMWSRIWPHFVIILCLTWCVWPGLKLTPKSGTHAWFARNSLSGVFRYTHVRLTFRGFMQHLKYHQLQFEIKINTTTTMWFLITDGWDQGC